MNSTYSSSRSQNDINNVIGHDIILSFTVAEANNVNYIQFLLMKLASTTLAIICLPLICGQRRQHSKKIHSILLKLNGVRGGHC